MVVACEGISCHVPAEHGAFAPTYTKTANEQSYHAKYLVHTHAHAHKYL